MNKKILLCGNPNVGKSTIFNELTSSSEYENNLKKNN
jgi:Fe2+ transport system protein B